MGIVAAVSIMAEFLPALLTNIPYRIIETWLAHSVCMWMAIAVLCAMVLTLLGSFFVDWPHMPIDPSTMAGAMYYVVNVEASSNQKGVDPSRQALMVRESPV